MMEFASANARVPRSRPLRPRVRRAVAARRRMDGTYATREVLCPQGLLSLLNDEPHNWWVVLRFIQSDRPEGMYNAVIRYLGETYLVVLS